MPWLQVSCRDRMDKVLWCCHELQQRFGNQKKWERLDFDETAQMATGVRYKASAPPQPAHQTPTIHMDDGPDRLGLWPTTWTMALIASGCGLKQAIKTTDKGRADDLDFELQVKGPEARQNLPPTAPDTTF